MNKIINFTKFDKKRRCVRMEFKKKEKKYVLEKNKMLLIENTVEKIIKENCLTPSPSIDIVSLVNNNGFDVETTKMDIETTGRLLVDDKEENKQRIITVNTVFTNDDNDTDYILKKSRFITAHEYGHFVLHYEQLGQPTYAHRDTHHRTEPIEQEADYFARSILMPINQFKSIYMFIMTLNNNNKKNTIRFLSETFQVTKNKVNKRLEDLTTLGLI